MFCCVSCPMSKAENPASISGSGLTGGAPLQGIWLPSIEVGAFKN